MALPYDLKVMADDQFNSVRASSLASENGLKCMPKTVRTLSWSEDTGSAIHQAVWALLEAEQRPSEMEKVYYSRLNISFQ